MTGLVLLAAGASSRLGEPKQELLFQGKTLLEGATAAALASVCRPIVVVLGANAGKISFQAEAGAVVTVHNSEWEEGMASSIRCGLTKLVSVSPEVSGCVFLVCDQPYVDATLLNNLIQTKNDSGKGIVASSYKETIGTPVLFDKVFFPELMALAGQEGAKKLVFKHSREVISVPFSLGAIDIDTQADYELLQRAEPEE